MTKTERKLDSPQQGSSQAAKPHLGFSLTHSINQYSLDFLQLNLTHLSLSLRLTLPRLIQFMYSHKWNRTCRPRT
jgi:hypothetical protein